MTLIASVDGPIKKSRPITAMVWYEGTDRLYQGEAVCYNDDYGTATDANAQRCNRVERPTAANNRSFAGVAARNYAASATGRMIEIYLPGSKCVPVAVGVDTTIGSTLLTFTVAGRYNVGVTYGNKGDAGRFGTGKFRGRGSAVARQTKTAIVEASMVGAWSLATDGVTLTMTDTTGLAVGDAVFLLGGEDDGTGCVIPGRYTIAEVTSGTVVVLSSSAVDVTPGSAATCTGYAISGENVTVLADLLEGPDESGGIEFISLPNAGGDDQPAMTGGVTYVCGGVTLAADAEHELAQGTFHGEKKAFHVLGTLTTSDFVADLVTAGIQVDGSTALAEWNAADAAGEWAILEFRGARWFMLDFSGGAQA